MSTISQQRSTIQNLANGLDWTKLKRAGVISRKSEGEYIIQMLHDAVQTLAVAEHARSAPARTTKKEEPSW